MHTSPPDSIAAMPVVIANSAQRQITGDQDANVPDAGDQVDIDQVRQGDDNRDPAPAVPRGVRRVTFVITSMPVGGAETLLVDLMRGFDRDRIVADVVCLKEPGPLGEAIADQFDVTSDLTGGKFDVRVLPRLVAHFRRRQTDVVITVGAGDKMFWGRIAGKIAGVSGVVSALHSTGWPDGVGRLNRRLDRITDAYIAVADSHGQFLHDFEGFPSDKVHVIRNGVDCRRFGGHQAAAAQHRRSVIDEFDFNSDCTIVGIVAALRSEKNHRLFVEAAAEVLRQHPSTEFLIVGDGPCRGEIEDCIERLGVDRRVHLLGNRSDTPRLLAAMDIFALTSLNEASPVSILEALACRTPVVATDVGSVRETVRHNETGMLVQSEDLEGLTDALNQLIADPKRRSRYGAAGRQLVVETGSLESMIAGYTDLIEQSCGRNRSSRQ